MDIFIDQGQDYELFLYIKAGDPLAPVDLTGATVNAQIRRGWNTSLVAQFECSIPDTAEGKIRLAIPSELSRCIEPRAYKWDVFITKNGATSKITGGACTIEEAVTRNE